MNATWRVRVCEDGDLAAVHTLLRAHGWAHRLGGVERLASLLAASQRAFVAEADDGIVGFVRAITDGQSNGYLSMLLVAPAWRRRGIGRALVEAAMGVDDGITWVLRADRDGAARFFARLGFERSTQAMERRRRELT